MTTWAQFRSDLKASIQALVPSHPVRWRDQPEPFHKPNAVTVSMHLQTVKGYGLTETRLIQGATLQEDTLGWRVCTVSFKLETNKQTDDGIALNVAEIIGRKVRSFNDQSSLLDMLDVNSVAASEAFQDDRAQSVVVFDMLWNVLITDASPSEVTEWFDTVAEVAAFQDPPGAASFLVTGSDNLQDAGNQLTV